MSSILLKKEIGISERQAAPRVIGDSPELRRIGLSLKALLLAHVFR